MVLNTRGRGVKFVNSVIYGVLSFLLALLFAWALSAQFNFFYGTWHDLGGIKEGIERYGPENRNRKGFEFTTRSQRLDLFAQINQSVHRSGAGLDEIRFFVPQVGFTQTLLTSAEVVHLQDVANLIDLLKWVVLFVIVGWGFYTLYFFKNKKMQPSWKSQVIGVVSTLVLVSLIVILIGAEQVFNQFHIWVFPKDHQWFFYYQDSLMSTMMMAPSLFAYIAITLLLVAILVFIGLQWLLGRLFEEHS